MITKQIGFEAEAVPGQICVWVYLTGDQVQVQKIINYFASKPRKYPIILVHNAPAALSCRGYDSEAALPEVMRYVSGAIRVLMRKGQF